MLFYRIIVAYKRMASFDTKPFSFWCGCTYPTCLQVKPCLQGPQAGCTVPPMYIVLYWLYGPHVWCSSRAGLQIEMAGLMAGSRTQQRSWSLQSLCLSQNDPGKKESRAFGQYSCELQLSLWKLSLGREAIRSVWSCKIFHWEPLF